MKTEIYKDEGYRFMGAAFEICENRSICRPYIISED